jgi:hypothetical protein
MEAPSTLSGGAGLAFGGLPALRLSAQKPLPAVAFTPVAEQPTTLLADGAPSLRVRTASGRFSFNGDEGGGKSGGGGGGGDGGAAAQGEAGAEGASHPHAPSPRDKNCFFSADPVPSPPAFSLDNDAVAPPPKALPPPRRDFFSSSVQQDDSADADGAVLPPPPPPPRAAFGRRAAGAPAKQRRGVSFAASLEVRSAAQRLLAHQ